MPTATPPYDPERSGHSRRYSQAEWDELQKRVSRELRPLYKDKDAVADPTFGHAADEWASKLLHMAESEVSTTNWIRWRFTNEQLRAEQADLLKILQKAETRLERMSRDLNNLLDSDIDVLECRDRIRELIPHVKATRGKISKLPKAGHRQKVQHEAAVKMTVQVLRLLETYGMQASATADKDLGYISDAVRILKIIGDALELRLDETTWKVIIIEARPFVAVDR